MAQNTPEVPKEVSQIAEERGAVAEGLWKNLKDMSANLLEGAARRVGVLENLTPEKLAKMREEVRSKFPTLMDATKAWLAEAQVKKADPNQYVADRTELFYSDKA
ncbi:MAG: hypothetical protein Q7R81_06975 [Candidatus Peregrinibacteria bacterium]|nr:hypothetical protein [Candidatus Peregrinibacteria bacterium]